jgi:hypothetical protein
MSKIRTATVATIVAGAAAAALSLGLAGSASASTPTADSTPGAVSVQPDPAGIYAPNTPIVINHSNQALTITSMAVDNGAASAYWSGAGPAVGQVIPAGGAIYVDWLEYFFGSEVDLTYQSTDGSTISTSTGMSILGGWGYGCDNATGSLKCDDNGTNPSGWDVNVTVDSR